MENKFLKFFPKKNQLVLILLVGILMVIIAIPTKSGIQSKSNVGLELEETNLTNVEARLETMLEKMQGVGKTDVMITFKDDEKVEGVLVIAEGAKNAVIVRNITEVVQALFEVDSHKIKVIERNQID